MFRSRGYFESKDVLFEEALLDELFQVFPKGTTMDDHVSLSGMIGAIFFCSEKGKIVPYWFGRLTHGRSLMMLKTSLMGCLSRVKCPIGL